jgi:hypothetical protein
MENNHRRTAQTLGEAADDLVRPWWSRTLLGLIFLIYGVGMLIALCVSGIKHLRYKASIKAPEDAAEWCWKILSILVGWCIVSLLAASAAWAVLAFPFPTVLGENPTAVIRTIGFIGVMLLWMDAMMDSQSHRWWSWPLAAIAATGGLAYFIFG